MLQHSNAMLISTLRDITFVGNDVNRSARSSTCIALRHRPANVFQSVRLARGNWLMV